jgi:hypothetical protein
MSSVQNIKRVISTGHDWDGLEKQNFRAMETTVSNELSSIF